MCFSNLPVEFDEDGDPYLADEADDISHPDGASRIEAGNDECGCDSEAAIDADPEAAHDAILAAMPETARANLVGDTTTPDTDGNADEGRDLVEGD